MTCTKCNLIIGPSFDYMVLGGDPYCIDCGETSTEWRVHKNEFKDSSVRSETDMVDSELPFVYDDDYTPEPRKTKRVLVVQNIDNRFYIYFEDLEHHVIVNHNEDGRKMSDWIDPTIFEYECSLTETLRTGEWTSFLVEDR